MAKVKYEVDDITEWDSRTALTKPSTVTTVLFSDLFDRYLPINDKMTCIEIGAIPGSFLVYFHKKFGYKITGVDFSENDYKFHDTMSLNKIANYEYIKANFLTHQFQKKYDVVASFGFVEHFDDFDSVIIKHCEITNTNGYLIITMPNFRKFQYLYHLLFDKENLRIHNLRAMDTRKLQSIVQSKGFETVYCGYYGNLEIWRNDTPLGKIPHKLNGYINATVNKIGNRMPNSKYYSPYIVAIYRKTSV